MNKPLKYIYDYKGRTYSSNIELDEAMLENEHKKTDAKFQRLEEIKKDLAQSQKRWDSGLHLDIAPFNTSNWDKHIKSHGRWMKFIAAFATVLFLISSCFAVWIIYLIALKIR